MFGGGFAAVCATVLSAAIRHCRSASNALRDVATSAARRSFSAWRARNRLSIFRRTVAPWIRAAIDRAKSSAEIALTARSTSTGMVRSASRHALEAHSEKLEVHRRDSLSIALCRSLALCVHLPCLTKGQRDTPQTALSPSGFGNQKPWMIALINARLMLEVAIFLRKKEDFPQRYPVGIYAWDVVFAAGIRPSALGASPVRAAETRPSWPLHAQRPHRASVLDDEHLTHGRGRGSKSRRT